LSGPHGEQAVGRAIVLLDVDHDERGALRDELLVERAEWSNRHGIPPLPVGRWTTDKDDDIDDEDDEDYEDEEDEDNVEHAVVGSSRADRRNSARCA
jgi:hypothetical protein